MSRPGTVYIMTTSNRRVLYIGVTSNLVGRVWEHRNKAYPHSFTAKYNCVMLVYYYDFSSIEYAIAEEKRLKGCNRAYKEKLIDEMNKEWRELWEEIQP